MKATIYDGNGKPTGHITYQTPFGLFWKWIGYLLLISVIGFVAFIVVGTVVLQIEDNHHQTIPTQMHDKGLHLYLVTLRWKSRTGADWETTWSTQYRESFATNPEAAKLLARGAEGIPGSQPCIMEVKEESDAEVIQHVEQHGTPF